MIPLLAQRGYESVIAYDEGDSGLYPQAHMVPGMKSSSRTADGKVEQTLTSLLERERPDVVHLHNVQNAGVVQACAGYGHTVMTAHDYRSVCPANMFYWKNGSEVCTRARGGVACFAVTLNKNCLSRRPRYAAYHYHRVVQYRKHTDSISRVIAPSGRARDRLIRAGVDARQVVVLPYFCPVEPLSQPRPAPERPTITFIGRIAPNKGQEYFIQALGLLPAEVRGVLVGNMTDESERSIRSLAERSGCSERLELRRWASREEIVEIFDSTSVFVFPSLWEETLGIVGLEALARGVPVVASDIGGVNEWLIDGKNGFAVPPKSAEAISRSVKKILSSREVMEAFGAAGISLVREKFAPQRHVDALTRIYEFAAGRS